MLSVANQRNLRYVFASVLLSFSIPTSVLATTLIWQGPYAGAYLGGGFGNNRISTNAGSVASTSYFATSTDINAVNNAGTWSKDPMTMIVGIQAGHDWVWKQMVYGVAFDYSTLSLSSSRTAANSYADNSGQYSVYTSMQTNWLFTLRGRAGYQTMLRLPSLFYITAGMAMTQLKVGNGFNDNSALVGAGSSNTSQNKIGWTAGAGIEIASFKHGSVDMEYLYVSVPSVKTSGSISNTQGGFGIPAQSMANPLSSTANFHANIVKIGLNYRFDE
jgi:outer membrane immunogenic protein